jgi:hypothetical protein
MANSLILSTVVAMLDHVLACYTFAANGILKGSVATLCDPWLTFQLVNT